MLERTGFSGLLTKFLRASFVNVESSILLNGVATGSIVLDKSVCQGCPLSPLLFITVFDVLSAMFQKAVDERRIAGVYFLALEASAFHIFYADDFHGVSKADLGSIMELKHILGLFGEVSGLVCAWDQTVASAIPAGPPPAALEDQPWKWEDDPVASNLFGIPTA